MSTPGTPSDPSVPSTDESAYPPAGFDPATTRQAPVVPGTEPAPALSLTKSVPVPESPVYEPSPTQAAAPVPPYGSSSSPAADPTVPHGSTVVDGEPALRTTRMRTVVLGLVLLVIAGAVLVGQLTDIAVDGGAVLLALMIGGGLLLIAGARRS